MTRAAKVGSASLGLIAKAKYFLRRRSAFEWAVFTVLLFSLGWLVFDGIDAMSARLAVQQTAAQMAQMVRDAQHLARDHAIAVTLTGMPARPGRASYVQLKERSATVSETFFGNGVSISGSVTFDNQGVPNHATKLFLRKRRILMTVDISVNGTVLVPQTL